MGTFTTMFLFFLISALLVGLIFWMFGHSEYEEERIIKKSYDEALTVVDDALRYCKFRPTSKYLDKGIINAESKWTMKSFGEHIQVILSEKKNGVHIYFYSKCKMELQVVDWGKNKQNAKQFFKAIKVMA